MDKPIFPDYPPTLGQVLANACQKWPDNPFLQLRETRYTYAQAERRSAQLARGLLALGIGKGTHVSMLIPNSPDWVLNWLALGRIGALNFPVSTLYMPRELDWVLKFTDIDTLLVSAGYMGHDYLERLERSLPGLAEAKSPRLALPSHPFLRRILVWGGEGRDLPRWAMRGPEALDAAAADQPGIDDALLAGAEQGVVPSDPFIAICTSGSMADPKVVVHTHGSAIRAVYMFRAYRDMRTGDHELGAMPLFWLGGLNSYLIPAMFDGASIFFPPTTRTEDLLDTVVRHRITRVGLWPVQKTALFDLARERGLDFSSVREGIGEPRDAQGNVIPVNRRVGALLGMTESFGPHGEEIRNSVLPESKAGSGGHAVEGIDRRIVNPDTGAVLPPGEVGELQIRGFSLMQGYYKKDRNEVFTADGWFPTGDLCRLDADGYIYFQGRHGELIKSMGANVAPREVELQLESLPGVREAIVFGMPDKERGEAVVAVVVPLEGQSVDAATLRTQLKDKLSSYKVPGEIVVMRHEEVPRTASGKSRKAELKKLLPELRAAR